MNSSEPLWLPPGSVRAILALILAVSCIVLALVGVSAQWLNDAFLLVIGFYFGSKAQKTGLNDG
jgi:hypothetical protein